MLLLLKAGPWHTKTGSKRGFHFFLPLVPLSSSTSIDSHQKVRDLCVGEDVFSLWTREERRDPESCVCEYVMDRGRTLNHRVVIIATQCAHDTSIIRISVCTRFCLFYSTKAGSSHAYRKTGSQDERTWWVDGVRKRRTDDREWEMMQRRRFLLLFAFFRGAEEKRKLCFSRKEKC